jgi:hypothetical protein
MKKMLFAVVISLLFLTLLSAQEKRDAVADMMKNLQTVEKTEEVPAKAKSGYDSINAGDLMAMMAFLSHDVLEGREVGTRGYDAAAEYARSLFALWGMKPGGDMPRPAAGPFPPVEPGKPAPALEHGYLQEFVMKEALEATSGAVLETATGQARRSRTFQPQVDFVFDSSLPLELSAPVVFAGYGISEKSIGYDDFAAIDVRDKIVMVLSEAPGKDDPASPFQKQELKEKYFPAMPGPRAISGDFTKAFAIIQRGALAVLIVKNSIAEGDVHTDILARLQVRDDKPILPDDRKKLLLPGAKGMPWEGHAWIRISREMADAILEKSGKTVEDLQKKITAKYKPHSITLAGTRLRLSNQVRYQLVKSANVIAFIEGSDPKLKNEAVVIGAHLDHLGRRGDYIYNGAEDNASGSCGVLAMARALAMNPEKPKRSIVFCLWAGEEEGLLGSRWYVEHPLFAMEKTLANLNLDMIARPWDEKGLRRMARMLNVSADELLKKIKPANFLPLPLSEQSPDLKGSLQEANRRVGFDILYRETPRRMDRMSGGSDHAAFAMAGRPWAFLISGMGDVYHTPGDSMEKFDGATMEKVSRLIYLAAFLLADR